MTSTKSLCKGRTKKGQPCQAFSMAGMDHCFFHEPSLATERAAARKAGGRARHSRHVGSTGEHGPVIIESIDDLLRLLGEVIGHLLSLENSLGRARGLVQAIGAGCKLLEASEVELRLRALEEFML